MAVDLSKHDRDAIATAGHNVGNLNETINGGFEKLLRIDRLIDVVKAREIKPLQDERKELWGNLNTDSGIQREDLKLGYVIYKRQRDATDLMEAEDRDRVLDNLRQVFGSMKSGGQLDFLSVVTGDGGSSSREPKAPAYTIEHESYLALTKAHGADASAVVLLAQNPAGDWVAWGQAAAVVADLMKVKAAAVDAGGGGIHSRVAIGPKDVQAAVEALRGTGRDVVMALSNGEATRHKGYGPKRAKPAKAKKAEPEAAPEDPIAAVEQELAEEIEPEADPDLKAEAPAAAFGSVNGKAYERYVALATEHAANGEIFMVQSTSNGSWSLWAEAAQMVAEAADLAELVAAEDAGAAGRQDHLILDGADFDAVVERVTEAGYDVVGIDAAGKTVRRTAADDPTLLED